MSCVFGLTATSLIELLMEFLRKFLRDCIVRKVKDDVQDFGDVFGDNVLAYYVDRSVVSRVYEDLCREDRRDSDDLQALTHEVAKWLYNYGNLKPYHVYLVWYAARALLMNGFTPVSTEQIFATFKQCNTEFAKCFSRKDDYMEIVHPCSDYVKEMYKNADIFDRERLDLDSEQRCGIEHVLKVRSIANKLLRCANTEYILVHKKWLPSDVPYGLNDYLYNGEYNVQDCDEDDDTLYRMLYEYEMYVNNRDIDLPRLDQDNQKVSFALYDWRHFKPAEEDADIKEENDVFYNCVQHDDEPRRYVVLKQEDDINNYIKEEKDYIYATTIKFIVSKKIDEYHYSNISCTMKLGEDELDKLAECVAEFMKASVNCFE